MIEFAIPGQADQFVTPIVRLRAHLPGQHDCRTLTREMTMAARGIRDVRMAPPAPQVRAAQPMGMANPRPVVAPGPLQPTARPVGMANPRPMVQPGPVRQPVVAAPMSAHTAPLVAAPQRPAGPINTIQPVAAGPMRV